MPKTRPGKPPRITRQSLLRLEESDTESALEPRAVAEIRLQTLSKNFDVIAEQVGSQFVLPMVKANAYGHGAIQAVRTLRDKPQLFGFGVASLEEALEVRGALGMPRRNSAVRVLAFSGTAPWSDAKGRFCEEHAITPVIASDDDWRAFVRGGWTDRLTYHLKFNTGMNRLGLSHATRERVVQELQKRTEAHWPEGVCTHLAIAETPSEPLTRLQMERWREIRKSFEKLGSQGLLFHFANSSAIWNSKMLKTEELGDIVRPGLSLYGVPPWSGAPSRGLQPVMQLSYTIALKHLLRPGDRVGYGGTYLVSGKVSGGSQWIAVATAGYADGLLRSLGSKGTVWIQGRNFSLAGRISMDLVAMECDASVKPGDRAYLLGQGIDPWTQAEAAGTIPYELLTSVSPRVKRVYVQKD